MKSSNIAWSPQVDHLRALAAIWIVLYHGQQLIGARLATGGAFDPAAWGRTGNPLWALVLEGHTAVALFMVLSGFIFAWGAWQREVDWRGFMINRLLRIYPLYAVVLLLAFSTRPEAFRPDVLASMVLPFANLQNLQGVPTGPLLAMSWAIAVEFQFYLLFPFLVVFLNRSPARFVIAMLALALLLRGLAWQLGANPRDLSYWHLAGRIDQFVLGMGAAAALHALRGRRGALRAILVLSVPLAIAVVHLFHRAGGWPAVAAWKLAWTTVEGAAWALLVLGYVGAAPSLPRLASAALARVGELSFSIYLLHFPLVTIVAERWAAWLPRPSGVPSRDAMLATAGLVLPLTVALSAVTFAVVERPFLSRRVRYLR